MNKKLQIVVIDDDLETQELISAYFKPKGFDVICFSDAETALKESQYPGNDWDVILTDFHLPEMSGMEFTIQIKKNLPNLPVILITTPHSSDTAMDAIRKGAYDFIIKPIHFSQLQIAVERALHLKTLNGKFLELREIVNGGAPNQNKIIGHSEKFLAALNVAKRVALSSANILITGESGTGKEVFAKFIHMQSKHANGPFVAINCSAIPENLLESELFGHAKGSFTGAHEKRIGLFEEAENGTLFLDEIGDLSLSLQAKLLRVLQEKQIKRVGENQIRAINCRVISATHKDLSLEVHEKRFREDLFFRLNVIPIAIPPLRDRKEDILPLAMSFLRKFAVENISPAKSFSKESVDFLMNNPWRGNVRELENAVERAVALCTDYEISLENFMPLMSGLGASPENEHIQIDGNVFYVRYSDSLPTIDEVVRKYVEFAVEKKGGARDKTAKELGIDRKTLYKRLRPEVRVSI